MFKRIATLPKGAASTKGAANFGELTASGPDESLWEIRSGNGAKAWVCLFRRQWESGILKESRWGLKGFSTIRWEKLPDLAAKLPTLFRSLKAASVAVRVPMQDHAFVQAFEGAGFHYSGGLVTLTQKPHGLGKSSSPKKEQQVRPLDKKDQPRVEKIALEAFKEGRFYHEPGLPKGGAKKIYGAWARNMVNYANEVWVAGKKGPLGFVSLKKDEDKKIVWIDLIAVAPEAQRSGLGGLLTDIAKRRTPKDWALSVKTEPENLQALGFYLKNGFRLESFQLDHIWRS